MAKGYHQHANARRGNRNDRDALMRLLCYLPAQSAPAKKVHLAADMKVARKTLDEMLANLQARLGITVESSRRGVFISPSSWRKAQELGMAYANQEAA